MIRWNGLSYFEPSPQDGLGLENDEGNLGSWGGGSRFRHTTDFGLGFVEQLKRFANNRCDTVHTCTCGKLCLDWSWSFKSQCNIIGKLVGQKHNYRGICTM